MIEKTTKIVATLGPASSDRETIRGLMLAGADVFRLNMSHGDYETVRTLHGHIRALEIELDRPTGILGDLQGPKFRCGRFEGGAADLKEGARFVFDDDPALGTTDRVQLPHPEILRALAPGEPVLVNDGLIRLRVIDAGPTRAVCEVTTGGRISDRKGVNVPGVVIPLSPLTTKDRKDLEFLCGLGIDWLALSFVQTAADIEEARGLADGRAAILAKIEKPAAVEAFDAILEAADGIMVARGDLGVEYPVHRVPPIQKKLVRACRRAGKPVIVATQMMESMVAAPVPTRAEVSDAATAIYEGADAIMLSAESATGAYPVAAVESMAAVAASVEEDPTYRSILDASRETPGSDVSHGIAAAAREIADSVEIVSIACVSQTGQTALRVARERPSVPIWLLTSDSSVARRLALSWGVAPYVVPPPQQFNDAVISALWIARTRAEGEATGRIIVTGGVPIGVAGSTNILRVASVDGSDVFEHQLRMT